MITGEIFPRMSHCPAQAYNEMSLPDHTNLPMKLQNDKKNPYRRGIRDR